MQIDRPDLHPRGEGVAGETVGEQFFRSKPPREREYEAVNHHTLAFKPGLTAIAFRSGPYHRPLLRHPVRSDCPAWDSSHKPPPGHPDRLGYPETGG